MRYVAVVLAIILTLVGCCNAHSPHNEAHVHRVYHVDRTFTDEEIRGIRYAVDVWSGYSKNYFEADVFVDVDTTDPVDTVSKCRHDACILAALSSSKTIQDSDARFTDGRTTLGLADGMHQERLLIVRDRLFDRYSFEQVVMHELGHSFGIQHIDDRSAVMFKDHVGAYCPNRNDMIAFCRALGCNTYRVKWCD